MHAGETYTASGLSEEITPLLLLCGVFAWSLWQVLTMVLLELYLEVGEGKASSLLPVFYGLSLSGSEPFAWASRGVYIGLPPRGTMVIWLGVGPSRLSLRPSSSLPNTGARRLAGPADRPDTIAVLLMTLAWSCGHGNSAAAWRAFTVTIPHLVWLMACGAHGRGRPTPGGRLPWGRLRGALAAFGTPADGWSRRP